MILKLLNINGQLVKRWPVPAAQRSEAELQTVVSQRVEEYCGKNVRLWRDSARQWTLSSGAKIVAE